MTRAHFRPTTTLSEAASFHPRCPARRERPKWQQPLREHRRAPATLPTTWPEFGEDTEIVSSNDLVHSRADIVTATSLNFFNLVPFQLLPGPNSVTILYPALSPSSLNALSHFTGKLVCLFHFLSLYSLSLIFSALEEILFRQGRIELRRGETTVTPSVSANATATEMSLKAFHAHHQVLEWIFLPSWLDRQLFQTKCFLIFFLLFHIIFSLIPSLVWFVC